MFDSGWDRGSGGNVDGWSLSGGNDDCGLGSG